MKKLGNIFLRSLVFFGFALASATTVRAQSLDKAVVQNMINSKKFTFRAQSVLPMSGMSRQLTSEYEVKFIGDSVVAYLPYYGRAYSAPYGGEGGIDFTSTQFEYKAKPRKKGGWDISIRPKDTKDVRELNLIVSENGSANLQVSSNNRQPISFQGYLTERK
jgi:Domain of unknown function (DUF4251)